MTTKKNRAGQTAMEYMLVLALAIIIVIMAWLFFTGEAKNVAKGSGVAFEVSFNKLSAGEEPDTIVVPPVVVPTDADGDGVPDATDACPNTYAPSPLGVSGCPDADGDGVADKHDPCPQNPDPTAQPPDCTTTGALPTCGNAVCDTGIAPPESCSSCPADCGPCGGGNGDGGEDDGEDDSDVIAAPYCGDEECNGAENRTTCPVDCAPGVALWCGDGKCTSSIGENSTTCRRDCTFLALWCGDGKCIASIGENSTTCPQDCKELALWCGDGTCSPEAGESNATCPEDCVGPVLLLHCGDGICSPGIGENNANCQADCPCTSDADCSEHFCPTHVPGFKTPKCLVAANVCYCGGVCGDGGCDIYEQTSGNCTDDCGLPVVVKPLTLCDYDGACDVGEIYPECIDCQPVLTLCGNGACDPSENRWNCPNDCGLLDNNEPGTKVGSYFFYWHNCPNDNCDKEQMRYHPASYRGYASTNVNWWISELQDLKLAGIDYMFPVSWGSGGRSNFRDSKVIPKLVEALKKSGSDIRVGLFDDTTSETCEYNDDNGKGYSYDSPMPIDDTDNWAYFYDLKIKPFYSMVPREYWATHNGESVTNGGRPIIVVYMAAFVTPQSKTDEMWEAIKAAFERDFGVEPFLVMENTWISFNKDIGKTADGKYIWGAFVPGVGGEPMPVLYTHRGYTVGEVAVGMDEAFAYGRCELRKSWGSPSIYPKRYGITDSEYCIFVSRFKTRDGVMGGPGTRLGEEYTMAKGADLILIETWNELWEGTGVCRAADYPAVYEIDTDPKPGNPPDYGDFNKLSPDYYIQSLRSLKKANVGLPDMDFTITEHKIRGRISTGGPYSATVRNDGASTWGGSAELRYSLLDESLNVLYTGTMGSLAGLRTNYQKEVSGSFPDLSGYKGAVYMDIDAYDGAHYFKEYGDVALLLAISVEG